MERAMMRRKRQRNHRMTISVIAALFLVFQLTVMPCPGAAAAQDSDDPSIDLGFSDLLGEEEQEEEPEEEAKEEQKLAEEDDEQIPEEEMEASPEEDEPEEETNDEEESEDITEQKEVSENTDEAASDDSDDLEEEDGDEAVDEEDDSEADDESGVFELTEETDDYTAALCFDSGIPFPEGSAFTVSLLTEEGEAYPEYCRLLSEAAEAEEVLLGFYAFAWEIPEDVCSEEELFLTLTLKGEEYTEREDRAYVYEEDRFTPSENTEAEEDTFYFTSAGQGLYALTAAECEQKELPPVDAGTDSLLMTDCLNSEEPEEAEDSNVTVEEKEAVIPAEEDTKEKVMDPPLKRMLIKNPAAAVGESEEEDLPLRAMSADTAVIQRDICLMHLSADGFADSDADHVTIDIKDQNGDVRDTLTLSAENCWTADWEALDSGEASFTAEETGIFDSSGNDLSEEWNCSVQTSEEQTSVKTHDGWAEVDSMNSLGTYVIAFESGDEQYLLAVANPDALETVSSVQYMSLTCEQNNPENASSKATWIVEKVFTEGIRIRNAAVVNFDDVYLTTRKISKKITFAMIKDRSNSLSQFENHHLKTQDNVYLRATSNSISSVASADQASYLTVYTPVTYNDAVREKTVCFSHAQKPPPVQYTTVTVRLTVGGNMREWDRAFPFTAAVDDGDPVSFTLMHAGEFELEDIPIGAKLRVTMFAPDYEVTSVFGDVTEGESSLTLSSVPEGGGTILFQADRSVQLSTGVRSDSGASHMLVLMAVFLCFTLHFVWNRKILSNNREENDL